MELIEAKREINNLKVEVARHLEILSFKPAKQTLEMRPIIELVRMRLNLSLSRGSTKPKIQGCFGLTRHCSDWILRSSQWRGCPSNLLA